ncbi:flagellar basal body P-ring formation chaperone FlgA [Acidimangrovimonas sediminis]|uniref:flagellar basal body P-ring formation chaperone FlgA n=1 Tax=Acidimangrovimonas sediminis TaxID=2056283 RepID=UPI000C800B10|nr:flagellar basal body P-ring formation chaperone FlgA [Acidimangrovimonas sediminis]
MRWLLAFVMLLVLFLTRPLQAETLIAAHTIRARAVLGPEDLSTIRADVPGALTDPATVIGQEARVVLYAGRPIRRGDVGPPALVERNQLVALAYRQGALTIHAEGRALGRAGAGEEIRVMNTASRTTISGTVQPDGSVVVGHGY